MTTPAAAAPCTSMSGNTAGSTSSTGSSTTSSVSSSPASSAIAYSSAAMVILVMVCCVSSSSVPIISAGMAANKAGSIANMISGVNSVSSSGGKAVNMAAACSGMSAVVSIGIPNEADASTHDSGRETAVTGSPFAANWMAFSCSSNASSKVAARGVWRITAVVSGINAIHISGVRASNISGAIWLIAPINSGVISAVVVMVCPICAAPVIHISGKLTASKAGRSSATSPSSAGGANKAAIAPCVSASNPARYSWGIAISTSGVKANTISGVSVSSISGAICAMVSINTGVISAVVAMVCPI